MAPRSTQSHPFDQLLQRAAEILASRLTGALGAAQSPRGRPAAAGKTSANARRASKLAGKKLDMSCRVEGCKNRSGGPRNGFMCEEHAKLPKKQQQAARDAWKAKHAA